LTSIYKKASNRYKLAIVKYLRIFFSYVSLLRQSFMVTAPRKTAAKWQVMGLVRLHSKQ